MHKDPQRTKRISRPNGNKSINRIEAELKFLLENCPKDNDYPAFKLKVKRDIDTALGSLRILYL